MDADSKQASIAIEMRHSDVSMQKEIFQKFVALKNTLHATLQEEWDWQLETIDDDGKPVSRISKAINGVNIFNNADWPAVISFLKPRMLALDNFWSLVKEGFL